MVTPEISETLKNENYIIKKYNWIEFRSSWDWWSIEMETSYILIWRPDIVDFDETENKKNFNDITLYHLFANNFLLEYDSEIKRSKNKKLFQEKFEPIEKSFNSVKQSDWNQIPQYYWEFEYEWKFYLITKAVNRVTNSDEINQEKWIYKWVIINPELYFWKVENQVDNVEDKVKDIL
jgi:hypothetical protein